MAQRNIPGLGPCEITRRYAGTFDVVLPNGDAAEISANEDTGFCFARILSGGSVDWEVAAAFTAHLRLKLGIPTPPPVRMSDEECEAYSADIQAGVDCQLRATAFGAR